MSTPQVGFSLRRPTSCAVRSAGADAVARDVLASERSASDTVARRFVASHTSALVGRVGVDQFAVLGDGGGAGKPIALMLGDQLMVGQALRVNLGALLVQLGLGALLVQLGLGALALGLVLGDPRLALGGGGALLATFGFLAVLGRCPLTALAQFTLSLAGTRIGSHPG